MRRMVAGMTAVAMGIVIMLMTGCAGSNDKINVVSREDGSGTRGALVELFGIEEKGADGSKKDRTTKEAMIANKTDVMLTNIASNPNAIGYVSMGSLNDTIKAVKIDGVEATSENVKNGSYTVARPFLVATKGEPKDLAKDFMDFMLSQEGQNVVSNGYIAVSENAAPFAGGKAEGKIVVAGSSSVTPVMEKLKEAYAVINPHAEIEIQMNDSSSGMTGTIEGTYDIGMASRDLKDSEKEILSYQEIALDGIAIIVNKDNAIEQLSKEQVKEIYIGELQNWGDIIK